MNCSDCKAGGDEVVGWGPMIHNELWVQIAEPQEYLCLPHIEKRLGREVGVADLIECPMNQTTAILLLRRDREKAL